MIETIEEINTDEVIRVTSKLGRYTHYLRHKPIEEWDGYDLSNFLSMKRKTD